MDSTLSSSPFYCDICELQTSSESQLRSHLLGQRHWYNKRQREESQRSVYVRGFPVTTQASQLLELFQQFGSVHKVVLDDKGLFAIVEFTSVDDALKALHCPHKLSLTGGHSLVVKPRNTKIKKQITRKTPVVMETEKETELSLKETEEDIFSTVQLKLRHEEMEKISELQTIDDQILAISSTQHMAGSSLQSIALFLSYLQSSLQTIYPLCRVIPFGSVVTGLTTPTSDVDAVVLTEWTNQDETCLGENEYFSTSLITEGLLESVISTGAVPSSFGSPAHVSMDTTDSSTLLSPIPSASLMSADTPTTQLIPANVKICGPSDFSSCSEEYVTVLNILSHQSECVDVMALPTARCPIVRFTHSSLGMNCDLSINRRLGPHNSRLLKAYINFDPRVRPLLLFLRSWVRSPRGSTSIKRTQLNNYSLSLMLIYALQKTTPPVLPCLQSPGAWPRNMEWYGRKGFAALGKEESVLIDRWNATFLDPAALLPSQNTASLGELLYHFFNFYSTSFSFSTHTVTIHCTNLLTVTEAVELAARSAPPGLSKKLASMKVSPLCVQDPIELTHNVTKSVTPSTLNVLVEEMSKACHILSDILNLTGSNQSQQKLGILSLFTCQSQSLVTPSKKTLKTIKILYFTMEKISTFLAQVPAFQSVRELLPLIDLSSQYILNKLKLIVLRCLVCVLESNLKFTCIGNESTPEDCLSHDLVSHDLGSHDLTASHDLVSIQDSSLHQSISTADSANIDNVSLRKRTRSDEDISDHPSDTKKTKEDSLVMTAEPLNIFDQFCYINQSTLFPSNILCTAFTNSWTGRRFERRHSGESTGCMTATSAPPVLQFNLSLVDPMSLPSTSRGRGSQDALVWFQLTLAGSDHQLMVNEFGNFLLSLKS